MSNEQATKRPWKQIEDCVFGPDNHEVCDAGANISRKRVVDQANAALIVKAVNAHDRLVEACERAMAVIAAANHDFPVEQALRAALDAAK